MKYVRLFENFKEEEEDIHALCDEYDIQDYIINPDGSIDVNDNVYLDGYGFTKLPIKFNKVYDLCCNHNVLETLEGSPNKLDSNFACNHNRLTTLKGGPNYVGASFYCYNNKLTTLEGAPNYVGGNFDCEWNNILTFEWAPNHVGRSFLCNNNPIEWIWLLFTDYSKIELLNDYDPLRIENGKGVCILSRLNGFLKDIGRSKVTDELIKKIGEYYEIR